MEMFNFLWLIWDHYLLPLRMSDTPDTRSTVANLLKRQIYKVKRWTQKYPGTYSDFYFLLT